VDNLAGIQSKSVLKSVLIYLLKKAPLIMQSRSVEKGPEIGTGTMLCRCISRMTSFVPFMRGGLRFMALPCCLVHCEVRQTQSSLHH
jgi:hypothetical protein